MFSATLDLISSIINRLSGTNYLQASASEVPGDSRVDASPFLETLVDKEHSTGQRKGLINQLFVNKFDERTFKADLLDDGLHVLKAINSSDLVDKLVFGYLLALNAPTVVYYAEFENLDIFVDDSKLGQVRNFTVKNMESGLELNRVLEFAKENELFAEVEQLASQVGYESEALLNSVLKNNLKIYNKGETSILLGKLLSDLQKDEAFVYLARKAAVVPELSEIERRKLQQWLDALDSNNHAHIPAVTQPFQNLPEELSLLNYNQERFKIRSPWLVDTNASLLESENNLIHTIISSNENINILILDNNHYDCVDSRFRNRRDVGAYCLQYGKTYTASICPSYSYSQAAQALKEADSFFGPSVVILHCPIAATRLDSLKLARDLIDQGQISLYRWNPNSKPNLKVDSSKPKATLEKFIKMQESLSLLVTPKNNEDPTLLKSLDKLVIEKAKESYAKLFGNLDRKKLLVLFGSDGGNAENLAKKLSREASSKGLLVRTMAMDAFETDKLASEEYVLFVVSTAGQGEFPGNARETWKALTGAVDLNLSGLQYSVMALGDSHYWPRPEDAHYFAKAGKDLDMKLKNLGGNPLTPIGIGNDRDADGYATGVALWAPKFWEAMGVQVDSIDNGPTVASDDAIKAASNYLRGTIAKGLVDDSTGQLSFYDTKLTKFHGIYQQDDRDIRELRSRKGMEPAYSFMIRVRVPGGVCTPAQYIAMDDIADQHANSTIKLTTRQAFQFHGVLKSNLKKTIQDINISLLDTIAACGDVNRNVMCNPNPGNSKIHDIVLQFSKDLSAHLTPATSAYHEIWLDKKLVAGGDFEPLYGKTYLPRKFKIAVAVPPSNDVDVLAHDLGFIAIVENDEFKGFNVTVGGGMGATHGNNKTYPKLALPLGFTSLQNAIDIAEKVMLVQKDYGDRVNRKHARLKYTIEDRGIEWFRSEVESRLGYKLASSKPYKFVSNGDVFGWSKNTEGLWSYTLFIQNGRIKDVPGYKLKTGLRKIAKVHQGVFSLTPNQHLVISKIKAEKKPEIIKLLTRYNINNERLSGLRLNSMACVALPTCALAMAESERYLPTLVDKIDEILDEVGLSEEEISIRMTGCPNGCARPRIAEIAFIGKAPGVYNMYLGGGFTGERLNALYKESIGEQEILNSLKPIIKDFAFTRLVGEKFGDFIIRKQIIKD